MEDTNPSIPSIKLKKFIIAVIRKTPAITKIKNKIRFKELKFNKFRNELLLIKISNNAVKIWEKYLINFEI